VNGGVYDGRRLLQEESVAQMHKLHVPAGPSQSGMGLGFMVDSFYGRRRIRHSGNYPGWSAFISAYPEERLGVAALANMTGATAAQGLIPNTALRLLAEDYSEHGLKALRHEPAPEEWNRVTGRYLWQDSDATLAIEDGVLALDVEGEKSSLEPLSNGLFRAHDGMFDGSEVTFEYGEDGKAARFYVVIWRADRQGDVVPAVELVAGEKVDIAGRWSGTCASPLGSLPVALEIEADGAKVSVFSAQNAAVEEFRADDGGISGHFELVVPGFGDFRVFLRLAVDDGALRGRVYARGALGEFPMRVEFTRG
jgi:hypothetical protein